MKNCAIVLENITKTFNFDKPRGISNLHQNNSQSNRLIALKEISFSVEEGEILGIIGLNGSGKTTLLRTIAGIYKPDSGLVQVNGILSPLLQLGTGFQNDLKARENIIMNGLLLGLPKSKIENRVDNIIEYAGLANFSNMKLKHYSSGMRSRLAFSIAIQIDSNILLIDEILSVGDIEFKKKSYESFISLKNNKKTILHSTHNLAKLSEFSDRILLLHKGQNIMIGKPEEVIKKYKEINSTNQI